MNSQFADTVSHFNYGGHNDCAGQNNVNAPNAADGVDQIDFFESAKQVIELATLSNKTLVTAESLTGGALCAALTAVPGASAVVSGGFVTYTAAMKRELLGVEQQLLSDYGAVSQQVARAMAENALKLTGSDVAISLTGNAGPTTDVGSPRDELGLVYIGVSDKKTTEVAQFNFDGSRNFVRNLSVKTALEVLIKVLLRFC